MPHQKAPHTNPRRQPNPGRKRRKKPSDLKGGIATEPRRFTVEVGPALRKGHFEIAIYASSDPARSQGMCKLLHRPGFQSFNLAAAALIAELKKSTEIEGTIFTTGHLRIVETKLDGAGRSISLPLREVMKAT